MRPSPGEVTRLLGAVESGNQTALSELLAVVYDELKVLAAAKMRGERASHTLQPTALVHEAYLRLVGQENLNWHNRTHFFGAAAEVMRRILVDYARARKTKKRGEGQSTAQLDDALVLFETHSADLLELDSALTQLAVLNPRQSRIVELRFFGGLSMQQIAELLSVSERTIERDWRMARAWLMHELGVEG